MIPVGDISRGIITCVSSPIHCKLFLTVYFIQEEILCFSCSMNLWYGQMEIRSPETRSIYTQKIKNRNDYSLKKKRWMVIKTVRKGTNKKKEKKLSNIVNTEQLTKCGK